MICNSENDFLKKVLALLQQLTIYIYTHTHTHTHTAQSIQQHRLGARKQTNRAWFPSRQEQKTALFSATSLGPSQLLVQLEVRRPGREVNFDFPIPSQRAAISFLYPYVPHSPSTHTTTRKFQLSTDNDSPA